MRPRCPVNRHPQRVNDRGAADDRGGPSEGDATETDTALLCERTIVNLTSNLNPETDCIRLV